MVAEILVLIWALVVAVVRLAPRSRGARRCACSRSPTSTCSAACPRSSSIYMVVLRLPAGGPCRSSADRHTVFWLSVLALALVYGAYVAEVYRAGIESIHWSQTAAARSLGLSHARRRMRYVVIPQAVRRIIPPLLNDFIGLQKDTALVSIVGVLEAFNARRDLREQPTSTCRPITGVAIVLPRHHDPARRASPTTWSSATSSGCRRS